MDNFKPLRETTWEAADEIQRPKEQRTSFAGKKIGKASHQKSRQRFAIIACASRLGINRCQKLRRPPNSLPLSRKSRLARTGREVFSVVGIGASAVG
jgi:hypothetical protein